MTWILFCARIVCGCSPMQIGAGDGCLEPLRQFTDGPRPFAVRADAES